MNRGCATRNVVIRVLSDSLGSFNFVVRRTTKKHEETSESHEPC